MDKVLIALSGGVDSTVAAHLLKQQGYDVSAVVMVMSEAHGATELAAKQSASQLGIPLVTECPSKLFWDAVVTPFAESYKAGKTPNPCIICNPLVKFKILLETAEKLGCKYIATGHYANIEKGERGYLLKIADNVNKDQTYMLYGLGQNCLSQLKFPLSGYTKEKVRMIAAENKFTSASAPDSQEICFIPDNNYVGFIENYFGKSEEGDFISPEGKVCGKHKGVINYTIGQRKGLGIALGKPVFVKKIDNVQNAVYLEYADNNMITKVYINSISEAYSGSITEAINRPVTVKLRSTAVPVPAVLGVCETAENGICINLDNKQPPAAPGQAAVIYKDGYVMGGGIIVSAL